MVKRLLDKSDILKAELDSGKYDVKSWNTMTTKMVLNARDSQTEVFRLADEINAKRKKKRDNEHYLRRMSLRKLNEERFAMVEKEKEVYIYK